jgi:hypothetical protein
MVRPSRLSPFARSFRAFGFLSGFAAASFNLFPLGNLLMPPKAYALERPKHTVLHQHRYEGDLIEIRQYDPYVAAETTVEADTLDSASNEGFRRLASFIFGENQSQEKMEMTAPVETRRSEKMEMTAPVITGKTGVGVYSVRFVMPSKYTLQTLPKPKDPRVRILPVPARILAVITFSGRWTPDNFAEHTSRLDRFLLQGGYSLKGEASVARYNPPITPWFLRTNEIQREIGEPTPKLPTQNL